MPEISGARWIVAPDLAFPQLYENYTKTIFLTGIRVAEQRAKDGQAWMKANASWQDKTGKARAGLHVTVKQSPGVLAELVFSHGEDVSYSIFLEIANAGKYGIIAKAIDQFAPLFWRDVQRIMNLKLATRS